MTHTFTVAPPELRAASQQIRGSSSALSGVRLTAPDTGMYGKLVGSAADDAEPATTEDINRLLQVLGQSIDALAGRVDATCGAYEQIEIGNSQAAQGVSAALHGGAL